MPIEENKKRMEKWEFQSSEEPGYHKVIVPGEADCRAINVARLNLPAGADYLLSTGDLEMHVVLMSGQAVLKDNAILHQEMKRFDSFYLPANYSVRIVAKTDSIFYIPGAEYGGIGVPSFRRYDATLPIGDIHQIHGSGAGRREVMFTLDSKTPASRLICGLTWSAVGAWTSWPPHQHEKDLEEAYCYFDMPSPKFGLHISYLKSGKTDDAVAHFVHSGSMVIAPCGYHPTVASPSAVNSYLWALAAFTPSSRSYDLAILDPSFVDT